MGTIKKVFYMHYVYLIQSINFPDKHYIGYTTNLKERLQKHNWGGYKYTTQHKPWKFVVCLAFGNKERARTFEQYLKSGSGNAFAKKRLW